MNTIASAFAACLLAGTAHAFAQPPVETRPPNATGQEPAFPGQTRAPQPDKPASIRVSAVADGLPQAWAMEFLPDGRMLVTAKAGTMHIVSRGGKAGAAISGVPKVDARGQGGLLDMALSPSFADDRMVFWSFSEARGGGKNGTSVARGRLIEGGSGARLEDVRVVFRQMPAWDSTKHFGSRLVFAPDGTLFVTVGERSNPDSRVHAQDLDFGMGKVFHIDANGAAAAGNPFAKTKDAQPEIWSYGHRNVQAAALDGDGRLWTVEHGARGGDELNRPEAGKNYGWPVITYGEDYTGKPIGAGITAKTGMEQPVYFWDPVIAPSGMAWYGDGPLSGWKNSFIVGGLQAGGLVILTMKGGRVATEEHVPLRTRIRDVKVGPDGAVYALTEGSGTSSILKIEPAQS